jgi:hypothetical protein
MAESAKSQKEEESKHRPPDKDDGGPQCIGNNKPYDEEMSASGEKEDQ